VHRAYRQRSGDPFGRPERVLTLSGFVEASSLSGDGHSLYYHRRIGDRFVIYRVTR
jgi:hypothetical protein